MAEPKTIHEFGEVGTKYVTNSKQLEETEVVRLNLCIKIIIFILHRQPFRTNSLVVAEPKSIHANGDQGNKFVQASKQLEDLEVVRG